MENIQQESFGSVLKKVERESEEHLFEQLENNPTIAKFLIREFLMSNAYYIEKDSFLKNIINKGYSDIFNKELSELADKEAEHIGGQYGSLLLLMIDLGLPFDENKLSTAIDKTIDTDQGRFLDYVYKQLVKIAVEKNIPFNKDKVKDDVKQFIDKTDDYATLLIHLRGFANTEFINIDQLKERIMPMYNIIDTSGKEYLSLMAKEYGIEIVE